MKKVTILGSTGSIGLSALDIIEKNPDRFRIVSLVAGENIKKLKEQVEKFRPKVVAVKTKQAAIKLRELLTAKTGMKIIYDEEGLKEAASCPSADIVISAISGSAGLLPTLAAIDAGKDVALANKETMVMAGKIVTARAKKNKVKIIPVDSEHSAIYQCLEGNKKENVKRIILTASGGPFFHFTGKQLKTVNVSQALRHPRWKMGRKVTIDSATMMNKGLEVIEAKWLFNVDISEIDVMIHPQSIVHSMVEFIDGAFIAQMGVPDMRIPIAYALTHPERIMNDLSPLDLVRTGSLEFYEPDTTKFPCLKLAREAARTGGTAPAVLNAADEVAVSAFLQRKIAFTDLPKIVNRVLDNHAVMADPSIHDILHADLRARRETEKIIERMAR